jgi:hypothetical protein
MVSAKWSHCRQTDRQTDRRFNTPFEETFSAEPPRPDPTLLRMLPALVGPSARPLSVVKTSVPSPLSRHCPPLQRPVNATSSRVPPTTSPCTTAGHRLPLPNREHRQRRGGHPDSHAVGEAAKQGSTTLPRVTGMTHHLHITPSAMLHRTTTPPPAAPRSTAACAARTTTLTPASRAAWYRTNNDATHLDSGVGRPSTA